MNENNTIVEWAQLFDALGSTQRLSVYLALIEIFPNGINIKDLQSRLNIKPSTLAHHIKILEETKFIIQEKQSKEIFNFANINRLNDLCTNVLDKCCKDSDIDNINKNNIKSCNK